MPSRHPFPLGESLPASVLGGIALVLTALGGVITAFAGFRRPRSAPNVPTSEQVWLETLYQLDLAANERDALQRDRTHLQDDVEHWRRRAQAAEAESDGWQRRYEQANAELIALLKGGEPK